METHLQLVGNSSVPRGQLVLEGKQKPMSLVRLPACEIPAGKDIIHRFPSMGGQLPRAQECSYPGSTPRLPFSKLPPPLQCTSRARSIHIRLVL